MVIESKIKAMLLECAQNRKNLTPLLWHIYSHKRREEILVWLIKNKIVGAELYAFWRIEFDRSFLDLIKYVLKQIDKVERPIYANDLLN